MTPISLLVTLSITFVFVAVFHRVWGGTMRSSVCEKDTEERDDDEPLVCVFMRVDFMIYHSQFTHAKPAHLLEKHEIIV